MARVGANLLYVVIYGPFRSCYLDPGENNQDPGNGEYGGYILLPQTRGYSRPGIYRVQGTTGYRNQWRMASLVASGTRC